MNCLNALEIIDVVPTHGGPPEGCDLQGATIDEAARHVQNCPTCQTVVRRRQEIDERIGQLTRDVPVPAGLRERLLARLECEPISPGRATPATTVQPPAPQSPVSQSPVSQPMGKPALRSRRRVLVSAVATCVMAALSVGVWKLAISRPASLSMDEIAGYALSDGLTADDLPAIGQFQGGLAVQLPKTMQKLSRMPAFRQLVDPQLGERQIAIYFFTIAGRKGRLAVIPAALVKDLPVATSFPGVPLYIGRYWTTAWVEGNVMYLCCVEGGDDKVLRQLRLPSRDAA